MHRFLGSACIGVLICAASAGASPVDPVALMANYNLITSGNAASNGDIEGAMLVGGDFTASNGTRNLFNNSARLPADKTSYIYGQTSGQVNVDNGGNVFVGGDNHADINFNGGGNKLQVVGDNYGTIHGSSGGVIAYGGTNHGSISTNGATELPGNVITITPPVVIADAITALNNYSATLAALSSNGSIITGSNSLEFSYGGTGQAVFAITGAQLAADLTNANISFNLLDPSSPVVVNVDLQGVNWSEPNSAHFASGTGLQNVLFNFFNGSNTTLNFATQWETSILAMGSTVTNSTPIEGSVAAASFSGYGELHNFPLLTPPGGSHNPPPTPVPEPASLSLLLAGLAGAFGLRRKKKAA